MLERTRHGERSPLADEGLERIIAPHSRGVVLLLEALSPRPLRAFWLDHLVRGFAPHALRRGAGEAALAVFLPDAGLDEGWRLKERLLDRAKTYGVTLLTGLASWPAHGSSPREVLASAAAAVDDERVALRRARGEEVRFEYDGFEFTLDVVGDFLSG